MPSSPDDVVIDALLLCGVGGSRCFLHAAAFVPRFSPNQRDWASGWPYHGQSQKMA